MTTPILTALEPMRFMGLSLKNRFIRSATIEGMAEADGTPGAPLMTLYKELATGGVGLISTGACCPDPEWIGASKGQLVLSRKSDLSAWAETARLVKGFGTRISLQMAPFVFLRGRLAGPSVYQEGVVAITDDDIRRLAETYARTAALARRAGLDAVQVHGGHGYGLSQFLSPLFNRRDDEYGGCPENRVRIFSDIRSAIAAAAGEDFPVWIKMNAFDGVPGGLTPDTACEYGPLLKSAGFGAIEVTGGTMSGPYNSRGPLDKSQWHEGYYLNAAETIKAAVDLPVIAVGGIRKTSMVHDVLSRGVADLIALSRPLIREPDLINRWAGKDPSPARCISCNGCLKAMSTGRGLYCVQEHPEKTATRR